MEQPGIEQGRDRRTPCRPQPGNGSRRPSRSDRSARSAARRADSRSKSSQSITIPAARAIAGRWIAWLVDPPVASRPTAALTIAFSSTHTAERAIIVAVPADLGQPVNRRAGQFLAQLACRD